MHQAVRTLRRARAQRRRRRGHPSRRSHRRHRPRLARCAQVRVRRVQGHVGAPQHADAGYRLTMSTFAGRNNGNRQRAARLFAGLAVARERRDARLPARFARSRMERRRRQGIEAWRAKHETDYKRDWATIEGLHFLAPGAHTAGSAANNDVVLVQSLPARIGRLTVAAGDVDVRLRALRGRDGQRQAAEPGHEATRRRPRRNRRDRGERRQRRRAQERRAHRAARSRPQRRAREGVSRLRLVPDQPRLSSRRSLHPRLGVARRARSSTPSATSTAM